MMSPHCICTAQHPKTSTQVLCHAYGNMNVTKQGVVTPVGPVQNPCDKIESTRFLASMVDFKIYKIKQSVVFHYQSRTFRARACESLSRYQGIIRAKTA